MAVRRVVESVEVVLVHCRLRRWNFYHDDGRGAKTTRWMRGMENWLDWAHGKVRPLCRGPMIRNHMCRIWDDGGIGSDIARDRERDNQRGDRECIEAEGKPRLGFVVGLGTQGGEFVEPNYIDVGVEFVDVVGQDIGLLLAVPSIVVAKMRTVGDQRNREGSRGCLDV